MSSSDCASVAVALDAEFRLVGPEIERRVPAGQFYNNDGISYLNKNEDELLTSIHFPPYEGWLMNYKKLRRRDSIDFPILGVATVLRLENNGDCAEARIVLGAVASSPLLAYEAEKMLIGERLTSDRIEVAAQVAAKLAKPMDNTDMTLGFRKKMVKRFVTKAIKEALEN